MTLITTCPDKQSGFTLIEVLVAFVVVSISVTMILQSIAKGNRVIALSNEYNRVTIVAESLLTGITAADSWAHGVDLSSDLVPPGFQWDYSIEPYADAEPFNDDHGLYEIELLVKWNSPVGERQLALKTLRLIPHDSLP